jgi:conserved oligomeric Golgi complex subunit 2
MQKSRVELQVIQDAIQEKLTQRATLREEKVRILPFRIYFIAHSTQTLLHLLLKLSESVTRLESLLLITSPEQTNSNPSEVEHFKMPPHLSNSEDNAADK